MRPHLVQVDLEVDDRDDLFRQVVARLHEDGRVKDAAAAVEGLRDRERVQSTAVGGGIAFPHARTAACPELLCAAIRLARQIDFAAPDDRPVDLVFLLLGPPDDPAEHVALLARLARLVARDGIPTALRQAPDEPTFREILQPLEA